MAQSPTKQIVAAEGRGEDDYGEWALDLKSNAFEGAMNDISSGFESERAVFEREFLTKFRELRRPVTKEIIDAVNSGRAAVEVVNDFFDKAIAEVMGFMHGRRQLDDALQGKLMHATQRVLETGIDTMLRRDREKKAFLKQSFENRIEESRVSSKVELGNATLVMEAKFERQISELKDRALREAEAMGAMLRAKDEDMRVAQAQFNSKLAAEKAGSKHYADQLKADLESTRAQLEFLRKSTASTSSAKSVLESERKALSDEMARLATLHKEERQRNELQMHKLRTELDEVKASQAAERKKIKDTTEQASKQLEMAHDQLRSMQFELQSMQQKVDVSSVRLAESEGSLKDLYGRYRESQSILSETLSSKDEHERAALVAQDTIIELTRAKDEMSITLQEAKEQLAAGEAKLTEMQSELEAVLKAQERNRKKLVESEMKVTMLNNDLTAQRSKQKELDATIEELREEIESLKIARDAAAHNNSSKNSSLAQDLEALQAEFDDARAVRELDKQGAEELIASLRTKIAELESRQDHVALPPQALQPTLDTPSGRSPEATASNAHVVSALKPAAAAAQPTAPSAAVAQEVGAVAVQRTHDVPVESASLLSNSTDNDDDDDDEPAAALHVASANDTGAASRKDFPENQHATRVKSRTPIGTPVTSASDSKAPIDELSQSKPIRSKPGSRDSHTSKASSAQPGARVLSSGHPQTAESAARLHPLEIESVSADSSLHEDARLWTASVASTSCGLSVSGMSGVQAASVFMDDAGKILLIDSASEVRLCR
jgi:chromosome segregation ATPase